MSKTEFQNPYHHDIAPLNSRRFVDIQGLKLIQLNLSTTATLGREESGNCREIETRVNEWTIRQNMAVVERWPSVAVWLYSEVSYT